MGKELSYNKLCLTLVGWPKDPFSDPLQCAFLDLEPSVKLCPESCTSRKPVVNIIRYLRLPQRREPPERHAPLWCQSTETWDRQSDGVLRETYLLSQVSLRGPRQHPETQGDLSRIFYFHFPQKDSPSYIVAPELQEGSQFSGRWRLNRNVWGLAWWAVLLLCCWAVIVFT